MRSRLSCLPSLLVLHALCGAQPLPAQSPSISILPRVGVLAQPAAFRMHFNDPPPEFRQVWRYHFEPAPVLGAAVEVGSRAVPFPLRLEMSHAPSLVLKHDARRYGPPLYEAAAASVSTLTAAAVLESERTCYGRLCPRLLLGAGAKRYRFDATLLWDDVLQRFAPDQTRPTLQLGAGLSTRFSRFSLAAEVNDYSNRVEYTDRDKPGRRVHDAALTLGLGYRLR